MPRLACSSLGLFLGGAWDVPNWLYVGGIWFAHGSSRTRLCMDHCVFAEQRVSACAELYLFSRALFGCDTLQLHDC